MQKILGRIPLVFAIAVFLSFIFLFGGDFAENYGMLSSIEKTSGEAPLKQENNFFLEEPTPEDSRENSAVEVSASPSDAIGKVSEQFLSPYSAKYQYDGVYLKNSTGLSLDIKSELKEKPDISLKYDGEPEVLIVHTHTTESYLSEDRNFYTASDKSRSSDDNNNMVKVGEHFADTLKTSGIGVIHVKKHHDEPTYNSSYSRAYDTISEYLKKYPSIKIVVDIHRDAVSSSDTKIKPTVTVDGKKAAQVMLIAGSETGSISNFPNWRENLRLSLRFHRAMEKRYPGLARTMMFASCRYNMNLTKGSMVLEVGTDANTLKEACYSAELAATSLSEVLKELK